MELKQWKFYFYSLKGGVKTILPCACARKYFMQVVNYVLNCRVAGARTLTMPPNEPATNIDGENRTKLLEAIKKLESETLEIPVVSGGEKIYTGDCSYQSIVSVLICLAVDLCYSRVVIYSFVIPYTICSLSL